jgi:predicted SpoU family rRNA methylase
MEEDAGFLAVTGELELWLVAQRIVVVSIDVLLPVAVFIADALVLLGCNHELIVHSFTVHNFTDYDGSFKVDFFQDLRIVIREHSRGCVEVLLII